MSAKKIDAITTFKEAKKELPQPLIDKPYRTTFQFAEQRLKFSGGEVFKFAAPQMISPYAPKLRYAGQLKRISINIMLLGNSGSGKTQLMELAEDIAPHGKSEWVGNKQTGKALQEKVTQADGGIQIIVNDMKNIMGDSELLKSYETIIADGRVKRDTARESVESDDIRAAMIGGAVPADVSNQVYGGLIFRIVPIRIQYAKNEQKQIAKHITENVTEQNRSGVSKQDIETYYNTIYKALSGGFTDVPKIDGYIFEESHRDTIRQGWTEAIDELNAIDQNTNLFRQLWDGFRFAALHGLLQLPNREVKHETVEDEHTGAEMEVGKVVLEGRDAKVGYALMRKELDTLNGFLDDPKIKKKMQKLEDYEGSGRFTTGNI